MSRADRSHRHGTHTRAPLARGVLTDLTEEDRDARYEDAMLQLEAAQQRVDDLDRAYERGDTAQYGGCAVCGDPTGIRCCMHGKDRA